jgi:tRNA(adenine34) deaminase
MVIERNENERSGNATQSKRCQIVEVARSVEQERQARGNDRSGHNNEHEERRPEPCSRGGGRHGVLCPPMDLETLMDEALAEARRARDAGEVPIGAIVEVDGRIIGRGFNHPIAAADPTAHAEIAAIRDAANRTGNYRLTGSTLCVTIEPCLMCVGALVHARVGRLVFGAAEPRTGAVSSTVRGGELPGHNHRFEIVAGVREAECRELMQDFFRTRR